MILRPFTRVAGSLLVLGASFVMVALAHATPDNLLVVPGQHLGRVFIGDSKAAVHRRLGAPQRIFKLAGGLTSELWRAPNKTTEGPEHYALEVVYKDGIVTQIEASNPAFRTKGGLATDSTGAAWLATLGKTPASRYRYSGGKPNQMYYDWMSQGVTVELREDGAEYYNYVSTVIVHRKGAKVVVDSGGRPVR